MREPFLLALNEERLVAAFVAEGGTTLKVQHVISHHRKERAVVTDTDDGAVGVAQILLEPRGGFEIEVIRGFVEQQDFGGRCQLPGQRYAPAFTAAERADAGGLGRFGVEADAHEHGVHLGRHLVAAFTFEPFKVATVLLHRVVAVIVLKIGRLRRQRLLEDTEIAEGIGHDFPQRHTVGKATVLVHERHAQPGHACHRPAGGLQVARDETNEGGFPGAVPTHHGPAVAGADGQGDVAKDFGRAEIHPRVADGDQRHADAGWKGARTVIGESNRTATPREAPQPPAGSQPAVAPANGERATPARGHASRRANGAPHRPGWAAAWSAATPRA